MSCLLILLSRPAMLYSETTSIAGAVIEGVGVGAVSAVKSPHPVSDAGGNQDYWDCGIEQAIASTNLRPFLHTRQVALELLSVPLVLNGD
ncbi:hypothetical protein NDI52_33915 [Leptolyngbya sp. PL-A3]